MTIDELYQLQEEIEDAKTEKNKLEGQKQALMQQLEDEWGCKTLKQAEKKVVVLTNEIAELEEDIEHGLAELNEKYFTAS